MFRYENNCSNKRLNFLDYVNILPAGATMRIGPNLHLIVPGGTCALPVTIIPAAAPVIRPVLQPAQISQPIQSTQPVNYTPAKVDKAC